MLWINGYTCIVFSYLNLAPLPGKAYWAKNTNPSFFVLKDSNNIYIHPQASIFSNASQRYQNGFNFAKHNLEKLRSHILISGNRLQMVAHSQGVAFAEGIAAFLYLEDAFVTELFISLQGSQVSGIPQQRNAINCRIEFNTEGDFIVNKRRQKLLYSDIEITESALKSGFIRYKIELQNEIAENSEAEYLYMRCNIPFLKRHRAHQDRQFAIWTAIHHALALYRRQPEAAYLFNSNRLQPQVLQQYTQNYN